MVAYSELVTPADGDVFVTSFEFVPDDPPGGGMPVGGELIPLDTTMVLLAGTQSTAAWMIPVIIAGIGFAIVIARKF